jgi:hypothetical protein
MSSDRDVRVLKHIERSRSVCETFTAIGLMQLASRPSSARRDLYSAYQQQYQYNDQYGAEASGGGVTPLTAMRPSRESTYQQQDQYNSQYQPHFSLLFFRYG